MGNESITSVANEVTVLNQKIDSVISALDKIKQQLEIKKSEETTTHKNKSCLPKPATMVICIITSVIMLWICLCVFVYLQSDIQDIASSAPYAVSEIKHLIILKYVLCLLLFISFCGTLLGVYKIYTQHSNKEAELKAKAEQDDLAFNKFLLQHILDSEYQQNTHTDNPK